MKIFEINSVDDVDEIIDMLKEKLKVSDAEEINSKMDSIVNEIPERLIPLMNIIANTEEEVDSVAELFCRLDMAKATAKRMGLENAFVEDMNELFKRIAETIDFNFVFEIKDR